MATLDPRIDAYIKKAQPFAQPILTQLRDQIHRACPQVEESIKWNSPAFLLNGKLLCFIASFKAHCALSFWAKDMEAILAADGVNHPEGMGHLGKIRCLADLPPKTRITGYLKQAAGRPGARTRKPALATPPELAAELAKKRHAAAARTWAGFTTAKRRDYILWITEAKRDDTRARRLATTLEWLAEGKVRHWKYADC